jgi:hypothetical protein
VPSAFSTALPCSGALRETTDSVLLSTSVSLATRFRTTAVSSGVVAVSSTATGASLTGVIVIDRIESVSC